MSGKSKVIPPVWPQKANRATEIAFIGYVHGWNGTIPVIKQMDILLTYCSLIDQEKYPSSCSDLSPQTPHMSTCSPVPSTQVAQRSRSQQDPVPTSQLEVLQ